MPTRRKTRTRKRKVTQPTLRRIKGGKRPKFSARKKSDKPLRDIINDGVTYSFLSEFLGCREQARLTYIEGYGQAGVSDSLEFGSLFHECCEASAAKGNCPIAAYKVVEEYIKRKTKQEKLNKSDLSALKLQAAIVARMYPIYFQFWKDREGIEFKGDAQFVAQEESFKVNHTLPSGVSIPLRGRFDAILRKNNGKLWLLETKTKSQIDHEGITSMLSSMDLQTMMYALAISKHFGEFPEGVVYNVVRKPALRMKQDETQEQFLSRIQDDVSENPRTYFFRWHVSLTKKDVLAWEARCFNPILEQVYQWWESIKLNPMDPWSLGSTLHYANPEGLYTRYGKSKYFDLLTRGVPVGLRQRTYTPPPEKGKPNGKKKKKKGIK